MSTPRFLVDPATWMIAISESAEAPGVCYEIASRIQQGCPPVFTLQGVNDLRDLAGIRPSRSFRPEVPEANLDEEGIMRLESLIHLINRISTRDHSHVLSQNQVEFTARHDQLLGWLVCEIIQSRTEKVGRESSSWKEFTDRLLALHTHLPFEAITPEGEKDRGAAWEELRSALRTYADNLRTPETEIPFDEQF